jgi:N-acetylmuramoyl-L-alanine amidase
MIDGIQIETDVPPVIVNSRTLVPARAVFEALGGTVGWNDSVKPAQVSISYAGTSVLLSIDSAVALVNGSEAYLDVPAQIIDGRTLIPVRFVSEALNFPVNWDAARRTVNIYSLRNTGAIGHISIDGIGITTSSGGTRVTLTGSGIMSHYTSISDSDHFTVDFIGASLNTTASGLEWHREISAVRGVRASQFAAGDARPPIASSSSGTGTGSGSPAPQPSSAGAASSGAGVGSSSAPSQPSGGGSGSSASGNSGAGNGSGGSAGGAADSGQGAQGPSITRFVFSTSEGSRPAISFSSDQTAMYLDFPKPAILFNPLIDGKLSVVLDPGHGAETAGKKSPDGSFEEYEFNRDMAKRIKAHLERHGVETIITVQDDRDLPLAERCRIANESDGDIFVSVHSNAFGNDDKWTEVNGWEIYIYKKGSYSEQLAKAIHSAAIPAVGLSDRGIKTVPYYVITNSNMPAVLVEHGFYTNQNEIRLLKSGDFRERLAIADAKGILSFFGVDWIEPQ